MLFAEFAVWRDNYTLCLDRSFVPLQSTVAQLARILRSCDRLFVQRRNSLEIIIFNSFKCVRLLEQLVKSQFLIVAKVALR